MRFRTVKWENARSRAINTANISGEHVTRLICIQMRPMLHLTCRNH
jgi:hypothetical protein